MLVASSEIPPYKKTPSLKAVLIKNISYTKANKRIIIKSDTKILVDTKRSIALLDNGDHVDVAVTEYSLYL